MGGDAGPPKKPEPGLLLLAAERLGLEVAEVVFVGDSENDVAAARGGAMSVIVVRGGYTARPADELGADLVVDRLDGVPEALAGLAGAHGGAAGRA